jgi:hypothetical protein
MTIHTGDKKDKTTKRCSEGTQKDASKCRRGPIFIISATALQSRDERWQESENTAQAGN